MKKAEKILDSKKTTDNQVLIEEGGATLPALARQATTAITNAIGLSPEQVLGVVSSETTGGLSLDGLLDRASESHRYTDLLERYDAVFYWRLGRDLSAAKAICPHGQWAKRLKSRRISPWQWHQAKHIYSCYGSPSGIANKTLMTILKEIGIYQEDKGKKLPGEPAPPPDAKDETRQHRQPGRTRATTDEHPRDDDTRRTRAATTVPSEHSPEAEVGVTSPPEDALPLAVEFSPPPNDVELSSGLAEGVEWLRRAAIWLAWVHADAMPAPKYLETHRRFLRVVDGWRGCRPKAVADPGTSQAK